MEKENNKYPTMRVHPSFKKRVEDFIDLFEKEKGIRLTASQATKIIDAKIEKLGGLKA